MKQKREKIAKRRTFAVKSNLLKRRSWPLQRTIARCNVQRVIMRGLRPAAVGYCLLQCPKEHIFDIQQLPATAKEDPTIASNHYSGQQCLLQRVEESLAHYVLLREELERSL